VSLDQVANLLITVALVVMTVFRTFSEDLP
jgi:hypothetical protein